MAGLEPFIDTIVVCTFTALIILSTGVWNRAPDVALDTPPDLTQTAEGWQFAETPLPGYDWVEGETTALVVEAHDNDATGYNLHRVDGVVATVGGSFVARWSPLDSPTQPAVVGDGLYRNYVGATLTAKAFDSVTPGLGKWLVTLAAWLFAISTMISWSYYGEQGMVFLAGEKSVLAYKVVYCLLIVVATLGLVQTDTDLDNVTGIGTGVMLFANIPICWFFGYQAMRAYKEYIGRLKAGQMGPDHPPPDLDDLLSGRDVEKR